MVSGTTESNDLAKAPDDETMTLLRAQDALYARLELLASKQRLLITHDDTDPLLALLADRQKLALELTRIAARLEPIRSHWTLHRQRLTPHEQAEAEKLLAGTMERLRRVIDNDECDARMLSTRKVAAATTLRDVRATSLGLSAYRTQTLRSGRFDETDEDS